MSRCSGAKQAFLNQSFRKDWEVQPNPEAKKLPFEIIRGKVLKIDLGENFLNLVPSLTLTRGQYAVSSAQTEKRFPIAHAMFQYEPVETVTIARDTKTGHDALYIEKPTGFWSPKEIQDFALPWVQHCLNQEKGVIADAEPKAFSPERGQLRISLGQPVLGYTSEYALERSSFSDQDITGHAPLVEAMMQFPSIEKAKLMRGEENGDVLEIHYDASITNSSEFLNRVNEWVEHFTCGKKTAFHDFEPLHESPNPTSFTVSLGVKVLDEMVKFAVNPSRDKDKIAFFPLAAKLSELGIIGTILMTKGDGDNPDQVTIAKAASSWTEKEKLWIKQWLHHMAETEKAKNIIDEGRIVWNGYYKKPFQPKEVHENLIMIVLQNMYNMKILRDGGDLDVEDIKVNPDKTIDIYIRSGGSCTGCSMKASSTLKTLREEIGIAFSHPNAVGALNGKTLGKIIDMNEKKAEQSQNPAFQLTN